MSVHYLPGVVMVTEACKEVSEQSQHVAAASSPRDFNKQRFLNKHKTIYKPSLQNYYK